ncbi:MAG: tyrosine-type recombinase/integrase [Sulfurimonas sp.]
MEKREFHIQRSVRKGLESLPKTTSSIRTVEMIDAVIEFFQNQYELTGSKNSYVFLTKTDNSFYDAKTIRAHSWMRTLKEANIEYRPLYQTRHSFASQMIQNGEDIIWVASMLGHSSPKMTLDKYAKYVKSETKKRGTFISNVMCTE